LLAEEIYQTVSLFLMKCY